MADDKQTVLFKVSIFAVFALVLTFSALTNISDHPQNLTFAKVPAPKIMDAQTRKALDLLTTFKAAAISDTTAQCFVPFNDDAQQVASGDGTTLN